MVELRTIEIDFDIHKLIETHRQSFSEAPNEVLRRLLDLPPRETGKTIFESVPTNSAWSEKGVTLPHGTKVKMTYNGRLHMGKIIDGKWVIEGDAYTSPSGAASGVARTKKGESTRLDGWIYWEAQLPEMSSWRRISALRQEASGSDSLALKDLGL